jgi:CheY-like chemotaxis protein
MRTLKRILLVEDEPDIQTITKMALETIGGLSVSACGSGVEAVKLASESPPDLIVLDAMMPGMDGLDTFRALRQIPLTRSIPVVFLTAKAQPHEIALYKELGALDVIPKPFDPMRLSETLLRIFSDKSAEVSPPPRPIPL